MTIEGALLALGAAASKAILRIWLDDAATARDVALDTVDLVKLGMQSERERRKLRRATDNMGDQISDQLSTFIKTEFADLAESDINLTVSVIQIALDNYPIDLHALVANN